jgi:hypothetical protein
VQIYVESVQIYVGGVQIDNVGDVQHHQFDSHFCTCATS